MRAGGRLAQAEHAVTHREIRHPRPDGLETASELGPGDRMPRTADAGRQPPEERMAAQRLHIGAVDRGRVDPDEDLIRPR